MTDSYAFHEDDLFKNIRCIVCGTTDPKLFQIKYHKMNCSVVKCKVCSFHFIPPFFRKSIDYTKYKPMGVAKEMAKGDIWLKIERNKLRFKLIQEFQKSGDLFDIGCGFGHFLLTAKELGYSIAGVEMSKANVEFVKNQLGIDIIEGNFLDVPEDKQYDLMTLWDVLEHIDYADKIIEKMSRLLKPGGYTFIQVPQIDSFFAILLRSGWWAMGLDHVNYFSKKTIHQLLLKHGLELVKIKSSIELKNILLYVILPKLKRKKKKESDWSVTDRQREFNRITTKPKWMKSFMLVVHNTAYRILSFFHIGDEMIVVARKKSS
jgi:2-polyprenyl-3-methyl-5-hydroxy-6-metoxy-1,4-benzoquinol methylase